MSSGPMSMLAASTGLQHGAAFHFTGKWKPTTLQSLLRRANQEESAPEERGEQHAYNAGQQWTGMTNVPSLHEWDAPQLTSPSKKRRLDAHVHVSASLAEPSTPQQLQGDLPNSPRQAAQSQSATFWRTAWARIVFYLGLAALQQPLDSAPVSMQALCSEEQHALRQILERVSEAEMMRIEKQLSNLQALRALDTSTIPMNSPEALVPTKPPAAAALAAAVQPVATMSAQPWAATGRTVDGPAELPDVKHQELVFIKATGESDTAAVPPMDLPWLDAVPAGTQAWTGQLSAATGQQQQQQYLGVGPFMARPRLGRPVGAGNRGPSQIQASKALLTSAQGEVDASVPGFTLRSPKYTGVYKSRRAEQGWRAQFAFANKVINLGTFDTAEDAARVWNEAALLLRGYKTWLNPVEPRVRPGHKPGELQLTSLKAVEAIKTAAVGAGVSYDIVQNIYHAL